MSRPERASAAPPRAPRYVWLTGLVALLVVVVIAGHSLAGSSGAGGIAPGQRIPPFAVPLALGSLNGDANIATHANDGGAGRVPACSVHLAQALNVCESYDRGPLVLALFVNAGGCPAVLADLQRLAGAYPGLQLAAVQIRGNRNALRTLVRRDRLSYPVGYDHDGVLADLYRVSSCPQVSFVAPGGIVAESALLGNTTAAALQSRVAGLVADARAHGWRPPA